MIEENAFTKSEEVEIYRQEALMQLTDDEPEHVIAARFSHNTELMDRANMMVEMWDKYILNHPAAILNKMAYEKAYRVIDMLSQFYQIAGSVCWPDNNDTMPLEVDGKTYHANIEYDAANEMFRGQCFVGVNLVEATGRDVDGLRNALLISLSHLLSKIEEAGVDEYGDKLEE